MMTKDQCMELLLKHYQEVDNEYKETGMFSNECQFRIDHSYRVYEISKEIISKNKDLFKDDKLNEEFLNACILHDIYKLDKKDHHSEYAGILALKLKFSNEIVIALSLHSAIKDYDLGYKDLHKSSNSLLYLALINDSDIVSHFIVDSLVKKNDNIKELIEYMNKLLNVIESKTLYFAESRKILNENISKMHHFINSYSC